MRGGFVLMILAAALLLVWQGGGGTHPTTASLMQDVMARSGASPRSAEAVYRGKLAGEDALDLEELESLAERVAKSLGIELWDSGERLKEEGFALVDLSGSTPSGIQGRVVLQSRDSGEGTFLLVHLQEQGGGFGVLEAGERVEVALRPLGIDGELTLDLTAHVEAILTEEEMNRKARALLREAGAEVVEGLSGENLVSLTGHTPYLDRHLYTGGKKININIAFRHESHGQGTIMRLGIPLISGGY